VIGTVGDTGNATTTHLHFEIRLEGEGVDPEKYLEEAEALR
jgi:murein DD-endopeptidase MepM/ murein hydrolase activator NlpD